MQGDLKMYISRFVELTPDELEQACSFFEYQKVDRKTLLLQEGQICHFESYIINGCVREYFIDKKGHEHTIEFAIEDWWVSDIHSFENKSVSHIYIETLEDTEFLTLSLTSKYALLSTFPKLERMFRTMMQRHLFVVKNRLLRNMSASAMDRYVDFLKRYPTISQRVPQYYIASYLGITHEFLSKLRKRHIELS